MSGGGEGPVAVVGAGSIGVAFALVFARAGLRVRITDPDAARRAAAPGEAAARLRDLDAHGLLAEPPGVVGGRVLVTPDLAAAVADAVHVQECAPERVELKRALFADLDRLAPPDAVLASSSSFLPASAFAAEPAWVVCALTGLTRRLGLPVPERRPETTERVLREVMERFHTDRDFDLYGSGQADRAAFSSRAAGLRSPW